MSWRDSLTWANSNSQSRKMASFRGAYFFVRDTGTSFGRRNVVHQYPKKDELYVEDLGKDTEEFSIEGYIVQNSDNDQNYFEERDILIKALKKEGPGQLWHPFLGVMTVSLIGKAEMTESFREGGIARFSMKFIKAEEEKAPPYPKPIIDHVKSIDTAADNAEDSAIDAFTDAWGSGLAGTDIAANSLASFNKMLRSVTASIQGAFPAQISKSLIILSESYSSAINLTTLANACSLANGIVGMTNGLLSLIGSYGDILVSQLLGNCTGAVRGLSNGPFGGAQVSLPAITGGFGASTLARPIIIAEDYGKSATRAFLSLANFGKAADNSNPSRYGGTLAPINVNTDFRAQEAANQEIIINMVRLLAISVAIRTAIRIDYKSHNAVIEMMNEIIDAINAQLLKLGNDSVNTSYSNFNISISDPEEYQSLESLKKVFVKSMLAIGADLTNIIEYKVPADNISSLVLAYDKYEDLSRENEIISRNLLRIKHPGFLPGGQTLELLNA